MERPFDLPFLQELCDVLHAELHLVCSFMDTGGHIIASSERGRIGRLHPVAQRIMRGTTDEYLVSAQEATADGSVREGINMALVLHGQRVLSLGLAGPLAAVRPLARVVRFCVVALLQMASNRSSVAPSPAVHLGDLLQQSQQREQERVALLHLAMDHIDQGFMLLDADMRLVDCNQPFLQLVSWPTGVAWRGRTFEEMLRSYVAHTRGDWPRMREQVHKRIARVRSGRGTDMEFVAPGGRVLHIQDRPLPGGCVIALYTDITERHHAQQALRTAHDSAEQLVRERTQQLDELVSLSSDWFWEQDAEFRFTRAYGPSLGSLHMTPDHYLGKRRWEMPIQGVSAQALAAHQAALARHAPFKDFSYEVTASDGSLQYLSVSGTPRFDAHGHFIGYHGLGNNLTALRQAEKATRTRERQLAQIVQGTPLATFVVDAQARVTHWNLACTALTGRRAEDMLGRSDLWSVFYARPRPTLINLVMQRASDADIATHYPEAQRSAWIGGGLEVETQVHLPNGYARWLHITAAPLRDADGQMYGGVETLQDVTERKRSLLQLQQAHDALEQRVHERTEALHSQLSFLQQLIEAIPSPLFYKDAQGRYLGCNRAFEAVVGRTADQILGRLPSDIVAAPLQAQQFEAADRELLAEPGRQIYEMRMDFADGQAHDVIFHKASFTRPDASLGGLVGIMLDITERKCMEEDLRQAATLFESAAEGVMVTQADGTIVAVNPAFTRITGYTREEALGHNQRLLHSARHDADFYAASFTALHHQGRWQGEIWSRRKSGEDYPKWLTVTAVRGPQDEVTHYVSTFTDVTQQKRNEERIEQLAFSDALTQLPNRRLLLDRLDHALHMHARSQRHGALFFIDIDNFKGLNDSRGHATGDLLLQQAAQRLRACVSSSDTVARLGGDEFVVMLEDLASEAMHALAQAKTVGARLLHALRAPYELLGHRHHCTASIGVTLFGQSGGSVQDLLKQADLAMYRAKAAGRNTLFFFDPQMQQAIDARMALEEALREALAQQRLQLHYQPQVDLDGRLVGVEALTRWQQADGHSVPPLQFIALAEETGLILPLGHWVLEMACRQLAVWAGQPHWRGVSMAVNVSARQFHDEGFVDHVLQVLERTGAPAQRLKLELTESLLIQHIDGVAHKMAALQAHGVGFSLDDFGTGYSSLAYLKRLPLEQLKIDQSFVRNVLTDSNDAAIARMVIALADTLGLQVMAEGVEQPEQRDFLAQHGCQLFQGYWFGRPMPLDALQHAWGGASGT